MSRLGWFVENFSTTDSLVLIKELRRERRTLIAELTKNAGPISPRFQRATNPFFYSLQVTGTIRFLQFSFARLLKTLTDCFTTQSLTINLRWTLVQMRIKLRIFIEKMSWWLLWNSATTFFTPYDEISYTNTRRNTRGYARTCYWKILAIVASSIVVTMVKLNF